MSGIGVPTFTPQASSWQQVEWIDNTYSSEPAVGGVATIELPQLNPDVIWLLDHMVISTTSTTDTGMRLYNGTAAPRYYRDGSDRGNFDVGEWYQGLLFRPSSVPLAVWTGCSAGAVATLTVQARLLRQVIG